MDQTYTQDSCCGCREQPGAEPASPPCNKDETRPNEVATPGPSESSSISEAYMAAFDDLDSIVGRAKGESGVRDGQRSDVGICRCDRLDQEQEQDQDKERANGARGRPSSTTHFVIL